MTILRQTIILASLFVVSCGWLKAETVSIVIPTNAAPRVEFGAEKLAEALKAVNMDAEIVTSGTNDGPQIFVRQPDTAGGSSEAVLPGGKPIGMVIHLSRVRTIPARFMAVLNWPNAFADGKLPTKIPAFTTHR